MWMRKMLDVLRAVLLWLLVVPVVVTVVDAALTYLEGRPGNAIVAFFSDSAELLTPLPVQSVLDDQTYWQTALLAVLAYALVAVLFVVLFGALRRLALALETERQRQQA